MKYSTKWKTESWPNKTITCGKSKQKRTKYIERFHKWKIILVKKLKNILMNTWKLTKNHIDYWNNRTRSNYFFNSVRSSWYDLKHTNILNNPSELVEIKVLLHSILFLQYTSLWGLPSSKSWTRWEGRTVFVIQQRFLLWSACSTPIMGQ